MSQLHLSLTYYHDGNPKTFLVRGRCAETLLALVQAGNDSITAWEMSSWALRLAAYIHDLRHRYGLDIVTIREEHTGGYHARYVLHTPVEIGLHR